MSNQRQIICFDYHLIHTPSDQGRTYNYTGNSVILNCVSFYKYDSKIKIYKIFEINIPGSKSNVPQMYFCALTFSCAYVFYKWLPYNITARCVKKRASSGYKIPKQVKMINTTTIVRRYQRECIWKQHADKMYELFCNREIIAVI